jgi:hypothetical protein
VRARPANLIRLQVWYVEFDTRFQDRVTKMDGTEWSLVTRQTFEGVTDPDTPLVLSGLDTRISKGRTGFFYLRAMRGGAMMFQEATDLTKRFNMRAWGDHHLTMLYGFKMGGIWNKISQRHKIPPYDIHYDADDEETCKYAEHYDDHSYGYGHGGH